MKIIDKIEIKHFRSFDNGKGQEKTHVEHIEDLNIFSGSNDSGKSNILRALNIFFYNEITPGIKFDMRRDFSKIVSKRFEKELELKGKKTKKEVRRSEENVSVKIHFHNHGYKSLPKKFWVVKIFSKKNNYNGELQFPKNISKGVKLAQVSRFINNIDFEYIPAIKDRLFFNKLFKKLQSYLFENEDKKTQNSFQSQSKKINRTLIRETSDLFNNFFESSGVEAKFEIPETLIDFFRTLEITTSGEVSLFDRGDGVQAKFIPVILHMVSKNNRKTIWGFEEPENSYESGNIKAIRSDFLTKYSRDKQIFLTTHAEEFLSTERIKTEMEREIDNDKKIKTKNKKEQRLNKLKVEEKSSKVSIYRVWKNNKNISIVTRFDERNNEWERIIDDMGIDIISDSRVIQGLREKLEKEREEIKKSKLSKKRQEKINKELNLEREECLNTLSKAKEKIEQYKKPILYVEDKNFEIYQIAYLKINNIKFEEKTLNDIFNKECIFLIRSPEGAGPLAGLLSIKNTDDYVGKKIIGLFDFDKEGSEKFYNLKRQNNWDDSIKGDINSGFYKVRGQHECFYSLLLPVPLELQGLVSDIKAGVFESNIEIENLLCKDFIEKCDYFEKKEVYDKEYWKLKKDIKNKFWKKLIILEKEKFKNFKPLFDKIEKLFKD